MAIETGSDVDALKARLLKQGERFSFFQAYRLLRQLSLREGKGDRNLKVRPNPSLAFPETDVDSIRQRTDGAYQLTVNFLGLHGVSSPLPTFYGEDILDDIQHERFGSRDFLDIISQTIYPLFFRAGLKSRPHVRIVEFDDRRLLQILYSFVGISDPERFQGQPGFESLLRFAPIYSQFPRSALGLKTIVSGSYPDAEVTVVEQVVRVLNLEVDQRMCLGQQATTLGEDTHIGQEFACRSSNLQIEMHGVDAQLFQKLLPGGYEFRRLQFLVRHYLVDPLHVEVDLHLKEGEVRRLMLGQQDWASLGRDAWLMSDTGTESACVRFAL